MKYALVFLTLGLLLGVQASRIGGAGWLLLWPACAAVAVSVAYAQGHPAVYGKRPDGSRGLVSWLLMLPYLLVAGGVWNLYRWRSRESPADKLLPGVWIGRRLLPHEIPPEITRIVDLTCEFHEPRANLKGREYRAVPILDASVPGLGEAVHCAEAILQSPGTTLIHCAQGHGRTGTLAAIVLLIKGVAQTPDEAVARLQSVRPKLKLNARQMEFVRRAAEELDRRAAAELDQRR